MSWIMWVIQGAFVWEYLDLIWRNNHEKGRDYTEISFRGQEMPIYPWSIDIICKFTVSKNNKVATLLS